MFQVTSILWPTDASDSSYAALEVAVAIAQKFNSVLHALQVVQQVPPLVTGSTFGPMAIKGFDVPLYQQELLNNAETYLQHVVSQRIPHELKVHSEVRIGSTAEVIKEFAQEKKVDLIVMATHGRSGFQRFMIGSVAEKTIRLSTIPTLIIPTGTDDASG